MSLSDESGASTRWGRLFADIEAELEAVDQGEVWSEVAERTRVENATLQLVHRLHATIGRHIVVQIPEVGLLDGELHSCGPDWLLLARPNQTETLVPLQAVSTLKGLTSLSTYPGSESHVVARMGLRTALRRLCKDRAVLALALMGGTQRTGVIDRVCADFLELAEHAPEGFRRARAVQQIIAVPFWALRCLSPL